MHENHHGYVMVFIAYLLSALLLALGSDTFYNINSKAADINTEIEEGTQEPLYAGVTMAPTTNYETSTITPEAKEAFEFKDELSKDNLSTSGDTVWLFGSVMNGETFESVIQQLSVLPLNITKVKKKESATLNATYSTAYGNVTGNEVMLLQRIVQSEAGGEDTIGKILIANVVLNRMKSGRFPSTIKGVILQHSGSSYQFSPVKSGRFWTVKISKDTEIAVEKALQGVDYSKGAMYFIAKKRLSVEKANEFDTRLDWLFNHGGHDFYKRK